MDSSLQPSEPLLPGRQSAELADRTNATMAPSSYIPIYLLSALKAVFGLACLLAPRLTSAALLLDPIEPQASVITRLYGGALVALGYFLFMIAQFHVKTEVSTAVLRRAVIVHIVADGVDVISCTVGYFSGAYGALTFSLVGGGCLILEVVGIVAYACM